MLFRLRIKSLTNYIIVISIYSLIFSSCKRENIIESFEIDFSNIKTEYIYSQNSKDTLSMLMDLTDAVTQGIVIPTINQSNDGFFHFKAKVKKDNNKRLYYKIYYQNESYKYDEEDTLSNENFYGSWEDTDIGFKELAQSGEIIENIRIIGNPRNEKIYFGSNADYIDIEQEIRIGKEVIRRDKKWYEDIKKKAKDNKISEEEQLNRDVCWTISHNKQRGETNNRYKRNPRAGVYSFLLVVVEENILETIPKEVKNISLKDSIQGFINPYSYFLYGKGKNVKGISTALSKQSLRVKAILKADKGVYVDILAYPMQDFKIFPNNNKVGNGDTLYYTALYEQYFHNITKTRSLKNIPLVEDILDDTYTYNKYMEGKKKYSDTLSRINDHPYITDYPGKTIRVNNNCDYISLINPGNKEREGLPRKESVGIKTRVGFTYGKFRGKIKFPAQLNKTGVWSGLTNAFWLIYQSEQDWNQRRVCEKEGFVTDDGGDGKSFKRNYNTNYSEIDIEIVKTSKYWGGHLDKAPKGYNPYNKDESVLACTNWDLACPSPKNFFKGGTHKYKYLSKEYTYLRWYDVYRALTSRETISNNIFHKDYYYYEIEWTPYNIIWRIGESPQNMYIVGYMSSDFTLIPNNQMLAVITQEYHYAEFWPPIIFDQDLLPYPKNDIEGRVYEVVIE